MTEQEVERATARLDAIWGYTPDDGLTLTEVVAMTETHVKMLRKANAGLREMVTDARKGKTMFPGTDPRDISGEYP